MEVIAAAVGAFLGAIFAFIIGLIVESRAKKNQEEENDRNKLRDYSRNISTAEITAQEALIILYEAERLFKQYASGIKGKGLFITFPRTVNLNTLSALDFRNSELINSWLTLRFRIDKINHLISEFNYYYRHVSEIHESLALKGESVVAKVVNSQYGTLEGFAARIQKLIGEMIAGTKDTYAYIYAHAEIANSEMARIKSVKELNAFKVNKEHYLKIRDKLDKDFNQEALYGDESIDQTTELTKR